MENTVVTHPDSVPNAAAATTIPDNEEDNNDNNNNKFKILGSVPYKLTSENYDQQWRDESHSVSHYLNRAQ